MITVKSKDDKIPIYHFVLSCLALTRTYVTIFDTSAFIATSIHQIAQHLPDPFLQRSTILVPFDDSGLSHSLAEATAADTRAFLIEDTNALLYLMAPTGDKSGLHHLSTLFHLVAYSVRINKAFVIGVVYKREADKQSTRSLAKISDVQLDAEVRNGTLSFSCPTISWPSGHFAIPLYLDEST